MRRILCGRAATGVALTEAFQVKTIAFAAVLCAMSSAAGAAPITFDFAGNASASYVYDVRLNQGGFFGDVSFTEPTLLTTLTTISSFNSNTLTDPYGNLAQTVVISPLVGGPECVVPPFLSAFPGCFGIAFAGTQPFTGTAIFGMLPDLTSPGVFGTPGHFSLAIHRAPEPSTLFLLALPLLVLRRRR